MKLLHEFINIKHKNTKTLLKAMKAIILIGGYAKRMEPLSLHYPKAFFPVGEKENIFWILEEVKQIKEVEKIIISANVNQRKFVEKIRERKVKVVYEKSKSDEDKLGAIRALYEVIKKEGEDDYLVIAGDNFFYGLNLPNLIRIHKLKNPFATIALFKLEDKRLVNQFGIAITNEIGKIIGFQEKPKIEEAKSDLASTSIYIISKKFIPLLYKYVKEESEKDNLGKLWQYYYKKIYLNGEIFNGFFGDIGNLKSYIKTNEFALNLLKSKGVGEGIYGNVKIENCKIDKESKIIGPCILRNCKITKSVIGPYSIINDSNVQKSKVIGSVTFRSKIEESHINESIIDESEVKKSSIEKSIMGMESKTINSSINESRIYPKIEINNSSIIKGKIK